MRASGKSPRILVIRRDNIGDLVCTTPLFDALRAALPGAWIGALVNTYNVEVLEGNRSLDAVYVYEKLKHRKGSFLGNLVARMRLVSSLRREKLDYVLLPSSSGRARELAATLKPRQVLETEDFSKDPRHEVWRAFSLAERLGASGTPGPMRVFPEASRVAKLAGEIGPEPFVAIHISARQEIRRWPRERYIELIRELRKESPVRLLWAPGDRDDPRHPGDDAQAREIIEATGVAPLPTPDLRTLIAALSLARLVICPDGGAMHIAAALGKPVVALWADSPVEKWRPWGVPHRVVRPPSFDLADLPLHEVLAAYRDLAGEIGRSGREGAAAGKR